jgi:hypothetical protein
MAQTTDPESPAVPLVTIPPWRCPGEKPPAAKIGRDSGCDRCSRLRWIENQKPVRSGPERLFR